MKEIKDSILVQAQVDRAYQVAEEYPLFVDAFEKKEILRRTDKRSHVRITNRFFNLPLTWEGKGFKRRNEKIAWLQTEGLLKGFKAEWRFIPQGEATEIVIRGLYKGAGPWGKLVEAIAPLLVTQGTKKILHFLKLRAEQAPWSSSIK